MAIGSSSRPFQPFVCVITCFLSTYPIMLASLFSISGIIFVCIDNKMSRKNSVVLLFLSFSVSISLARSLFSQLELILHNVYTTRTPYLFDTHLIQPSIFTIFSFSHIARAHTFSHVDALHFRLHYVPSVYDNEWSGRRRKNESERKGTNIYPKPIDK